MPMIWPAPLEKLGPMPPDSDPAAQAAWRSHSYDQQIEVDHRVAVIAERGIADAKAEVDRLPATPADDPRRLRGLQALDQFSGMKALSELHAQAAQVAKDAYAQAETIRLQVAAGKRPAGDLTAARAKAAQAERIVAAALQARVDQMMVQAQAVAKITTAMAQTNPDLSLPPLQAELAKVVETQQRAKLEAVAYGEVRDAVEAGKRPASDLEAARQSLKTAQAAMYDLVDEMQQQSAAMQEQMHQRSLTRIKDLETQIAAQETKLPSLEGEARTGAEARLSMLKQLLESTTRMDATMISRTRVSVPRPELPILPPRS